MRSGGSGDRGGRASGDAALGGGGESTSGLVGRNNSGVGDLGGPASSAVASSSGGGDSIRRARGQGDGLDAGGSDNGDGSRGSDRGDGRGGDTGSSLDGEALGVLEDGGVSLPPEDQTVGGLVTESSIDVPGVRQSRVLDTGWKDC